MIVSRKVIEGARRRSITPNRHRIIVERSHIQLIGYNYKLIRFEHEILLMLFLLKNCKLWQMEFEYRILDTGAEKKLQGMQLQSLQETNLRLSLSLSHLRSLHCFSKCQNNNNKLFAVGRRGCCFDLFLIIITNELGAAKGQMVLWWFCVFRVMCNQRKSSFARMWNFAKKKWSGKFGCLHCEKECN